MKRIRITNTEKVIYCIEVDLPEEVADLLVDFPELHIAKIMELCPHDAPVKQIIGPSYEVEEVESNVPIDTIKGIDAHVDTHNLVKSRKNQGFVTAKSLAKFYAVTEQTIYRWSKEGRIPSLTFQGTIRFDFEAVRQAIEGKEDE